MASKFLETAIMINCIVFQKNCIVFLVIVIFRKWPISAIRNHENCIVFLEKLWSISCDRVLQKVALFCNSRSGEIV